MALVPSLMVSNSLPINITGLGDISGCKSCLFLAALLRSGIFNLPLSDPTPTFLDNAKGKELTTREGKPALEEINGSIVELEHDPNARLDHWCRMCKDLPKASHPGQQ